MPIVRSSFTPHGQNFKIPKIDFCDVITSVLYSVYFKIVSEVVGFHFNIQSLRRLQQSKFYDGAPLQP